MVVRVIYKFILSIITTFILFCAFCFSAFGAESEYGISDITVNSSIVFTHDEPVIYTNYSSAASAATCSQFGSLPESLRQEYDNYVLIDNCNALSSGGKNYQDWVIWVYMDPVDIPVEDINYVLWDFTFIDIVGSTSPSVTLWRTDGGAMDPSSYTVTITKTPVYTYAGAVDIDYYNCRAEILFHENIDLSGGLSATFSTDFPAIQTKYSYIFGLDNLRCGYVTVNEYLEGITSGLSSIEDEITILTDVTLEGNAVLKEMYTWMSEPMDEATSIKLKGQEVFLADIRSEQQIIDEQLQEVFAVYEDYEYDFVGNQYDEQVHTYVDPLYENEEFSSFWFGLWSQPFIYAMMIVVLAFVMMGFALYGVR